MYSFFFVEEHFEKIIEMFANHLGNDCEIVLHDLSKGVDSSIIQIHNGHVTGRSVGGPITNLGLNLINSKEVMQDRVNSINQLSDGRILRSSSYHVRNPDSKIIGSICINQDITDLITAQRAIKKSAGFSFECPHSIEVGKEVFVANVSDLLDHFIAEYQSAIEVPVANMTREDKIQAVKFFDERGAFLIAKAGDKINKFLNISKYTLYQYLDIVRKDNSNSEE